MNNDKTENMKNMSKEYWQQKLTPEQYGILRESKTEYPGSGKLLYHNEEGIYSCVACGQELFKSDTKFDSGSGWPSFSEVIAAGNVELKEDLSHGLVRTEISCANCGSHLGHVFDEDKQDPTKGYFCVNSAALDFQDKTD